MDISSMTPDKQVKLQYWLNIIHECRTSGLTNQAWCEQNGIHLKSYYYWLARIRKMALEDFPRKNHGAGLPASFDSSNINEAPGGFAEVPIPVSCSPSDKPAAILRIGNISVELFEQTPPGLLVSILKAVQSC